MRPQRLSRRRIPAFGPAIEDLEGRQLKSVAHPAVHEPRAAAIVHVHEHVSKAGHVHQAPNHQPVHIVHRTTQARVHNTSEPSKAVFPNAPSIIGFNGKLYRAANTVNNGTRSGIEIECSSDRGATWTKVSRVAETSFFDPALVAFNGRLYLAWTGIDAEHHINIESSADGVHWGGKSTLADSAYSPPTLAVSGERLYLAWAGTDANNHINVASSSDGVNFDRKVTLAETTNPGAGVGITALTGGGVVIMWAGRGGNPLINYANSADGLNFSHALTLPVAACPEFSKYFSVGPSVVNYDGHLVLTFVDNKQRINTMWSDTDVNPNFRFQHTYSVKPQSGTGPQLAVLDGAVYMEWAGRDGQYHTLQIN